jgi:ribosomal protein S18 acetylase RimI-like enzyme
VEIRPLRGDEADRLIGLWKEFMNDPSAIDKPIPTHEENAKRQREFVTKLMEEDPSQVMVAAEGGELVGYIMFQNDVKPPLEIDHKLSYVMDLFVRPAFRRRGLARRLLLSCLDALKKKGATDVQLRVWHMNKGAISLYRKLGFKDRMITMQLVPVQFRKEIVD